MTSSIAMKPLQVSQILQNSSLFKPYNPQASCYPQTSSNNTELQKRHASTSEDFFAVPAKKVKTNISNTDMRLPLNNIGAYLTNNLSTDSSKPKDNSPELEHLSGLKYEDSTNSSISSNDSLESRPKNENEKGTSEDAKQKAISALECKAAALEVAKERVNYASFFGQMHDNLLICMKRQLEFLSMLKDMNQPQYATLWPVLDKINPLVAGVMNEKSKIEGKSLAVMKRTHRLLKAGPTRQTFQPKKKSVNKAARAKENEASVKQLMKFILQDVETGENCKNKVSINEEDLM